MEHCYAPNILAQETHWVYAFFLLGVPIMMGMLPQTAMQQYYGSTIPKTALIELSDCTSFPIQHTYA